MDHLLETEEGLALRRNEIIGGNFRRIRNAAGLTQAEVAEKLFVDRTTYSRYEGGARVPENVVESFAKYFRLPLEELMKNISAALPDTSALMKEPKLLALLLQDFDHILIPGTVIEELDFQKDHGKDHKRAWQALCALQDYRDMCGERIVMCDAPGTGNNDSRIVAALEAYRKKTRVPVILIHDDIGLSHRCDSAMLLRDYLARRETITSYPLLLKLDQAYGDLGPFAKLLETRKLDLNAWLPDGNTLLIHCIRGFPEKVTAAGP